MYTCIPALSLDSNNTVSRLSIAWEKGIILWWFPCKMTSEEGVKKLHTNDALQLFKEFSLKLTQAEILVT